jgi:TRAP-type transport system periplasmic protein
MKSKVLFISVVVMLMIGLVIGGCAEPEPTPAPTPAPIELKLNESYPASHPMTTEAYEVWAKMVEDVTDGRVKVSVFPGDALAKIEDAFDATIAGVCDISMISQPFEPERFPLTIVMNTPLGLPNAEVAGKVGWDLYQKFPEIQAEHAGVKVLFFYSTSAYQLHTANKPIHTLEDIEGLLIRCGGPEDTAITEALGGTPEFLPMPDSYLALEKGVLDGHMGPFGPMLGFQLDEVLSCHLQNGNFHTNIFAVIMNLDKWNSLPSDIQEAIEGISGTAAAEMFGEVFDGTDQPAIQAMKDKGHTFTNLSAEEKARLDGLLKDILDDWVAELEAKGLPGQEVLDEALRLAEKYSE